MDNEFDNKSLIEAYKDLNAGFIDLVGAMSLLRALSTISLEGLTEQKLLAKALRVLVLNQDLERCSIFLLTEGRLVNAAGLGWADLIGLPQRPAGGHPASFAPGEGVIGMAASTGKLQHCRNCRSDPRFVSRELTGATVGSLIAVPIRANGETIGILNVSHPHPDFFTGGHERTLQVFANFLGQLMVGRRLLARMDSLVQERTEQLEQALEEAESLKQRYADLSLIDDLTGLHNRRFFFPEAHAALSRALRYGTPFSVILLDLDHFKLINDTCGHACGDNVLRRFAELLRHHCREADILARFGGEEFVVALPDTDLEGGRHLAERVRLQMKLTQWPMEGRHMQVTASLGLSCTDPAQGPGERADMVLERLIREADQALYFGKHNGRDRCCLYPEITCFLDGERPAGSSRPAGSN